MSFVFFVYKYIYKYNSIYRFSTNAPLGNVRTIEGARGLKLVVSVEKPEDYNNEQSDDQFDELDLDELDEDVSVPTAGFPGKSCNFVLYIYMPKRVHSSHSMCFE